MVPSSVNLSNYLSHMPITVSHVELISLNGPTYLAVICYVIKFSSNLSDVIRRLNDLALERSNAVRWGPDHIIDEKDEEISKLFVNSFVPEVQSYFNVPKVQQLLHKDESIKENEILAVFMDFLLQVLNSEANIDSDKEQRYAILQKELTYLLSILGDMPFQCTGLEEVQALNTLIKDHFSKISVLPICITPRTDAVDSTFIVDSLLEDLENVMKCQSNLNMEGLKNQIKSLHEGLTFSRSFLQDIQLPHGTCMNEVKESLIKIRDAAYEAEYLTNSQVVGNIPHWYVNLRLPAIIRRIQVTGTRLKEIKKFHDSNVLEVAKDFGQEASLQKIQPSVAVDNFVEVFEDTTKILGDLVGGPEELKIISIFGMPGVGKTTIANKLYNDRSIVDRFDLRAWCVVSQKYQRRKVLIDILMAISRKQEEITKKEKRKQEENEIQDMEDEANLGLEIYRNLKGRR